MTVYYLLFYLAASVHILLKSDEKRCTIAAENDCVGELQGCMLETLRLKNVEIQAAQSAVLACTEEGLRASRWVSQ